MNCMQVYEFYRHGVIYFILVLLKMLGKQVPEIGSIAGFRVTHWFVSFLCLSSWLPSIWVPPSFSGGVHVRVMQFLKALTTLGGAG